MWRAAAAVVILSIAGSWATLPLGWKACSYSSPEYKDCLIKEVNNALKTMKMGYKSIGVNSIDPLKITSLTLEKGTGALNIKLELKDIDITGLSSCKVNTLINDKWKQLTGEIICEQLDVNADYAIDGKVLTLPIQGEGKCAIEFGDSTVNVVIKTKENAKGGKKYFEITTFNVVLNPKLAKFRFDNLFNGNKQLGDTMNQFINENSIEIFNELKPVITQAVSKALIQISNQIFSKIPSEEINIK